MYVDYRTLCLWPGATGGSAQAGLLNAAVANGSFNNVLSFGSGNVYA
jgi:hypothetical protein